MPGRQSAVKIELNEQTYAMVSGWLHRQKTPLGLAKRAQAILRLSQGQCFTATAKQVGLTERHVHTWERRLMKLGMQGL